MIIKVKNPRLFQDWLSYFQRVKGKVTYKERAAAFYNSQDAIPVPLMS